MPHAKLIPDCPGGLDRRRGPAGGCACRRQGWRTDSEKPRHRPRTSADHRDQQCAIVGARIAVELCPRERANRRLRRSEATAFAGSGGFSQQQLQRREHQRKRRQSHSSWTSTTTVSLPPPLLGTPARPVGVSRGRRARQRVFRRHGQLGSDPRVGDFHDHAHKSGSNPVFGLNSPGGALGDDSRPRADMTIRAPRSRPMAAPLGGGSFRGKPAEKRVTSITSSPAATSTKTDGGTCRRRGSIRSSARSAGEN